MPIFELGDGRTRPVQPLQPLAGTFVSEVRTLLADQLAAVVGEALFPVRARASLPEHVDAPELLALDSGGRPVVIEATQVVDDDALVAALRHTGAAGRLTSTDLARAYHPDPARFVADFATFRDRAPFAATSTRRDGARLILLCAEVAAEAADTLAALYGPGRHVTVLQVGVIRGADHRRWLEVAPLAPHEPERRSVESAGLRLVAPAPGASPPDAFRSPPPGASPPDAFRVPVPIAPAAPVAAPAPGVMPAPVPLAAPVAEVGPVTAPVRVSISRRDTRVTGAGAGLAPPPAAAMALPGAVLPPEPLVVPPPAMAPAPPIGRTVTGLAAAGLLAGGPLAAGPRAAGPFTAGPFTAGPLAAGPFTAGLLAAGPPASGPAGGALPGGALPGGALPELTVLAKSRRAVTLLVWSRERRGQRFEAMLRGDGLLQLPDGSVFTDPDEAAAYAAGGDRLVDGWRAWRLGDGGPSLAEAAGR